MSKKKNKKGRTKKPKLLLSLLTCPISCPALVTCTLASWWIDTIAGFASTLITNLHAAIDSPFFTKRLSALCLAMAARRASTSASALSRAHMRGTVYLERERRREVEVGGWSWSECGEVEEKVEKKMEKKKVEKKGKKKKLTGPAAGRPQTPTPPSRPTPRRRSSSWLLLPRPPRP